MLCDICNNILQHALELQICAQGILHDSFESFYESVKEECLICRRLWYEVIEKAQREAGLPAEGESFNYVPASSSTFISEMQSWFGKMRTPSSGEVPRYAGPGMQTAIFTYSVNCSPSSHAQYIAIFTHSSRLLIEFSLTSIDETDWSFEPSELHQVRVRGKSTSAMPEVWLDWFEDCMETHYSCRVQTMRESFTPSRLIEINAQNRTWKLVLFGNTDDIPYVSLSHCWGRSKHIKLKSSNVASFCNEPQNINTLPRTYRHAIRVATILGTTISGLIHCVSCRTT